MATSSSTDVGGSTPERSKSFAHVAAASWGKGLGTLLRILRLTLRHPWQVAVSILSTFIVATLQLFIPRLLGRAIDQAQGVVIAGTGAAAEQTLWNTALTLLAVSVLWGIFTMAQNYFGEAVGHQTGYELRLAFYEKIQRLSFAFHDRIHTGDLITLGLLDVDGVRMFFTTALLRVALLGTLIGAGAYLLISTDLMLGLLSLSFVPFVAWRSSVTQLALRRTWLTLQERLTVLSRVMDENLGGTRVVRAFGAQDHEMAKFDLAKQDALDLAAERVDIRVSNTSAMNFSFLAAMGLVLWFGGLKVTSGQTSIGTLAQFLTFMTMLQMPVRQLGMMINGFARALTCGTRLFELLDTELDITDAPGATDLVVTDGVLRFEDVGFYYEGSSGRPALSGITFEAKLGETVGIVGPPGSGKSTIAHLIPRFYDVVSGAITIDGQDIRSVTLQSLRKAVGVVQQDAFLFTTSIENNIAYGNPWARETRIERAAEYAQLHNYIIGLPAGYATVVGERGASLSGGQRQRLTIARSLMLRPSVLVFDDSTAAVDAGTEQRIRAAMKRFANDRVTLIISHRLSSLMHADQILFMEDGRIVERGTHEELLELSGRYRALHDLQLRPDDDSLEGTV
ncbi:ABC transporter ATP-binding protein [Mesorhizobium sp. WSM4887]|uniref:ABC transporter ATP-binding protein n=1 Tax=Mesorhizobium sp. WSM4887 TaxID=3038543 RepID=UPI002415F12C|nr:ABC transporter ATP-binding protein [Mesorhizobium sp. WSM4887]MDG4889776.1 ABC transporter ATP-binding protein [Mesorhizobium sp. WSM4887]